MLIALPVFCSLLGTSCMTTYDAYGRPVQSVDPALAVAGVATAGLVGYALANDQNDYHSYRPSRPHYGGGYGYGGGSYHRPYRPYEGGHHHRPSCGPRPSYYGPSSSISYRVSSYGY